MIYVEYLREVFNNLTIKEVQNCRLVCSEWKYFIDQYVLSCFLLQKKAVKVCPVKTSSNTQFRAMDSRKGRYALGINSVSQPLYYGYFPDLSQLTCPAPVSQVTCDGLHVYCSVAGSSHVFVYTCSDTLQVLQDVLQPEGGWGTIWSLQTGTSVLVGVTETSVIIWAKQTRELVAR